MRRFVSCLLICCMMFSSVCYGQSTSINPKSPTKAAIIKNPSEEVLRAISYGAFLG